MDVLSGEVVANSCLLAGEFMVLSGAANSCLLAGEFMVLSGVICSLGAWPFPSMDSEVSVVAKPLNRQLDYFYIVFALFL